mgnify:CR=1 FL=1
MTATGIASDTECLQMHAICKRFGSTAALQDVSFTARRREVHALVGENGAGKSTLMKVLSGALAPDSGTMVLDGLPYHPRGPLEARRRNVAMIYQELSLAPHLTVAENILLGVEPGHFGLVARREMSRRAQEAMARLQHPEISPTALVGELSPAAQQLVEIGRSLAVGCRVLVLDEPTSSLTSQDVERLFAVIAHLRQEGHAIVYISHFLEEVKRIADRITVLRDGRVVGAAAAADLSPAEIVSLMVGRRLDELYPRSPRTPGEVVLEVESLRGSPLPLEASLALRRGEVLGIFGLVGAGRTELLRTLFGLAPVRAGEVRLGAYAGPASPLRRWRQGVGYLSEDRAREGLALGLSLADNLTLSHLGRLGPPGLVLPRRQETAAAHWMRQLGIRARHPRQKVAALSGGNQQKVALARLLHSEVDVLLLDEPTRGIDVASKALIYQLVDALAGGRPIADEAPTAARPRAVLMVSSYLPELVGVCDRIAVMCRGRLGPAQEVADVTPEALLLAATGQEAGA